MIEPVKYVCDDCGSDATEIAVWCAWDQVRQKYEPAEVVDGVPPYCKSCRFPVAVDEVEITDTKTLAQIAIHKAEKEKTDG